MDMSRGTWNDAETRTKKLKKMTSDFRYVVAKSRHKQLFSNGFLPRTANSFLKYLRAVGMRHKASQFVISKLRIVLP